MSEDSPIEKAEQEVTDTVHKLVSQNKNALNKAINDAFCVQEKQDNNSNIATESNCRWFWKALFVVMILGMFLMAVYMAHVNYRDTQWPSDTRTLQIFLAFVVALVSYLSNAARETVRTLSSCDETDRIRHKKNIFFMSIAEIQLVIISIITVIRLLVGPAFFSKNFIFLKKDIFDTITVNSFLASYLVVTLLWIVFINVRIWCITSPWDVYKPPSK